MKLTLHIQQAKYEMNVKKQSNVSAQLCVSYY